MRVICEYQAYAEPPLKRITSALFETRESAASDELAEAMHRVAGEARMLGGDVACFPLQAVAEHHALEASLPRPSFSCGQCIGGSRENSVSVAG